MKRPEGSLAISGTEKAGLIQTTLFQREDEHVDLELDTPTIPHQVIH